MKTLRTPAVFCVLLLGLFSAACSGNKDSASVPAPQAARPARILAEVPHPPEDPYGKYNPSITVKVIHTSNDGAFWFPPGDSIDNNIYTRRYEKDLGIKYEFLWTSPGSQGAEKFNLMLSSGELPDFLLVNKRQFEQLYAAGLLHDMTDAIVDYANDYLREHLTGNYQDLLECATRDGRYYGFGAGNAFIDIASVAWLRKDYMDALGFSTPETIDELDSFMAAVKSRNPTGMPPNQSFPLASRGADQGAGDYIFGWSYYWMFNSYPGVWYKNSKDEIEHGMFGAESRSRTRAALVKAHDFYQKGYISPSFSTDTYDLMLENLAQGKAAVNFGSVWDSWWPLPVTLDNNPNADWLPVTPPRASSGAVHMAGDRVNVSGILVTTKDSKYPEALVKMSNLFLDLNDDPAKMEFNAYNTDPVDANQIFLAYPLVIHNPAFNIDALHDISEAQISGDPSNLCEAFRSFYDTAMAYEKNKDIAGWPAYRSYLKDGSSLEVTDKFIRNGMVVYNEYIREPTQFMVENEPTVKKLFDAMAAGVISGALDISEYDTFISRWDSIYGNTATKEVNDWYNNK
jgi:putative aldouronate transport system substrate-binding protein